MTRWKPKNRIRLLLCAAAATDITSHSLNSPFIASNIEICLIKYLSSQVATSQGVELSRESSHKCSLRDARQLSFLSSFFLSAKLREFSLIFSQPNNKTFSLTRFFHHLLLMRRFPHLQLCWFRFSQLNPTGNANARNCKLRTGREGRMKQGFLASNDVIRLNGKHA